MDALAVSDNRKGAATCVRRRRRQKGNVARINQQQILLQLLLVVVGILRIVAHIMMVAIKECGIFVGEIMKEN